MRFGFLLCKLLLQLAAAAAAAVGLRYLVFAAAAVSRCRCCFSSYLLLLCWLAGFVARLGEMIVLRSRVFMFCTFFWSWSVVFRLIRVSIEAVKNSKHGRRQYVGQFTFAIC